MEESDLDLVVASTDEGRRHDRRLRPGAARARDARRDHGRPTALNQEVIALQHELLAALGLPPYETPRRAGRPAPRDALRALRPGAPRGSSRSTARPSGTTRSRSCTKRIIAEFCPEGHAGEHDPARRSRRRSTGVEERVVRELILDGKRPDGRGPKRPPADLLRGRPAAPGPRLGLFQRGETQALVTTVLGTAADEQRVDGIMDEYSKKFMLDYNMPPFAVGEVRPIRGPGRREIGHGALAERSVAPILPGAVAVPLHDPGRLRHPRVERLQLDGLGLRRDAQPDGRRRADQRPGRRDLDRPGPGRGQPAGTSS